MGGQWAIHLARRHSVTLLTYRKRERGRYPWDDHGIEVVEWLEPPSSGVLNASTAFSSRGTQTSRGVPAWIEAALAGDEV